jgi:hypothetical protein
MLMQHLAVGQNELVENPDLLAVLGRVKADRDFVPGQRDRSNFQTRFAQYKQKEPIFCYRKITAVTSSS